MTIPEIKTPADLKGRRVGVTRIGAVAHVVLQMMLHRWMMNPSDVQVMQVGTSPDMLVSLDKKGIDAAVLTIPSMFVAEDRGYMILLDMADTDMYYLHTMIGSTRSYIPMALSARDSNLRRVAVCRARPRFTPWRCNRTESWWWRGACPKTAAIH